MVCPSRVNTKKLPTIPTSYHYRQEIIIPVLGTVQMADVSKQKYMKLIVIMKYKAKSRKYRGIFEEHSPVK